MGVEGRLCIAIFDSSDDFLDVVAEAAGRDLDIHRVRAEDVTAGKLEELVSERSVDVVVWEVAPPYHEGWVHAERVRADAEKLSVGLVVMTTQLAPPEDRAAAGAMTSEVLRKPFAIEDFLQATAKAAERRR